MYQLTTVGVPYGYGRVYTSRSEEFAALTDINGGNIVLVTSESQLFRLDISHSLACKVVAIYHSSIAPNELCAATVSATFNRKVDERTK